jgi:hypothetical protein
MDKTDILNLDGTINATAIASYLDTYGKSITKLTNLNSTQVYDVFPSPTIIANMSSGTVFVTKGFYTKDDGYGCIYFATTEWKGNALHISAKYIVPLSQEPNELFLPYLGIRTGSAYAESNSTIMASISYVLFGSVLRFPSGHFYFDKTLSFGDSYQIKITGAVPVGYPIDMNIGGMTWLHFPNLSEGQVGFACTSSTVSNIIFHGNSANYNCNLDRTKTVTAPDQIITETKVAKTYGVKTTSFCDIQNCGFKYFYYGVYCDTANVTMDNIFGYNCHIVASVGNDAKISRIFGWNVMIVLQIRGSLTSASCIRGDSVGSHLVHVTSGWDVYLEDLDADYCMKSVLHLGDGSYSSIGSLYVNGIHGRSNVYRAYDTTQTSAPNADSITTSANVEEYPIISVNKQTTVASAKIIILGAGGGNPLDVASNYLMPNILLAADVTTTVRNIELSVISSLSPGDTSPLTPTWIASRIKTLSTSDRNLEVAVKSAFDQINYKQSGSTVSYSKLIPQIVSLSPTISTITSATATVSSKVSFFDTTSNSIVATLPTAVGQEDSIIIKLKTVTSGNTLTLKGSGTETIDGQTSMVINTVNTSLTLYSDGSNWYII